MVGSENNICWSFQQGKLLTKKNHSRIVILLSSFKLYVMHFRMIMHFVHFCT